ncbi:MAG: universal stress protein [Coriobacteriales bacterium]|jgi:nucleotide-binding universal stress UspA family protein
MYKHFLVPYDKSETATRALHQAVEFMTMSPEAKLDILYVTSIPDSEITAIYSTGMGDSDVSFIDVNDLLRRRNEAMEEEKAVVNDLIADDIAAIKDRTNLTLRSGVSTVDEIVTFADENNCDLIIMGCRGLGALRGMLGSVSYGVLRSSKVPVLIIK